MATITTGDAITWRDGSLHLEATVDYAHTDHTGTTYGVTITGARHATTAPEYVTTSTREMTHMHGMQVEVAALDLAAV